LWASFDVIVLCARYLLVGTTCFKPTALFGHV
jgi:hypothetical protein